MAQQASSRKSQAENTMTTTTTAAEMMSRNGEDESQQQAAMVAASEEAADDPFGHFRQQQSQQHPDQQQQPAKMQVRSSQVDQDELVRLVQVEAMQLPDLGLVVSGMSGRFPKCDSVNEFEENLREGRDMVNDQDNSRFTCGLWNLPPRAGRLKDLSRFDNEFFGFTLEEANYIDFQLRILYEVVYESILDAGLNPAELRGTNTGVFFGLHCNEFENAMADDPAFKTNGYYAQFAIKVAQYFDLRGITVTFDAACASGFVGLHNAVEALRDGIVEQAIVCSSNIPVHPTGSFIFYQMQMLSPTGYSRFLDSRADGYVKSEACVSIVLQRQHLAKRNYASFMATMTSVDGYKPEGITFPSDKSQETLIRGAKELAGVSTNHVEYLEAHGTGTPAGDPQEARAISNVYYSDDQTDGGEKRDPGDGEYGEEDEEESNRRDEEQGGSHRQVRAVVPNNNRQLVAADRRRIGPLLVGSVKTNMGHSEAASGLCALVKVTLMLENELIYKNLHFDQPNTNIEPLMDGRLRFVNETLPLRSRIIPLSCYGFGGSNVHVIVRANKRESIPQLGGTGVSQQHLITTGGLPRLIVMFGRGEQQLEQFFDTLLDASSHNTRNCLTDDYLALLDSVSAGKIDRLMNYRGFCLLDARQRRLLERSVKRCDLKPLREALLEKIGDRTVATTDLGRRMHHQEALQRRCHLAFSGLGCQWAGMASGLAKLKPFWDTIKRLDKLLEAYKSDGLDIVGYCLAESGGGTTGKGRHGDTTNSTGTANDRQQSLCESFVSIVAYQVAMVNLIRDTLQLKNLGSLVGHSLGEVSCAYAASLFDEREAIMVAYQLGKTLDGLKPLISGKMVAIVGLDWQEVAKVVALHGDIYQTLRISCINGPNSVTLSGRVAEVDEFMLVEMELYRNSMMVFEVSSEVALHNEAIMNKPEIREPLKRALERVLLPLTDYDRTKTSWVSSFLDQAALDSSEHKEDVQIAKQANVAYFVEMLCRPINMNTALEQLEPDSIIYELSPSNGLESQINQLRYTPIESAGTGSEGRRKSSCSSLASSSAGGGSSTNALTRRAGACGSLRRASAMDQSKRKFHYIKCMQRGLDPDKQLIRVLSSLGELYQTGATFKLANLYTAQTGSQVQFPVRRQTPSLSSLISWDHSSSLFVPRYPIQFSKSSAKCEIPIDIVQDRDKYLTGHCIDGRVLYPATAYLLMIWRVFSFTKRKIYDACFQNVERELMPIEFRDVRLLRAVILGQRLAQLYVHFEEATGKFEVKEGGSVVVEGYAVSPEENPQGLLYDEVRERMVKEKKQEKESAAKTTDTNNPITEVFELSKDDVYKQFRVNGYDYGDSFQCIESSSFDGRVSRIKFNGHFVSLTDSILQSIFLTITRCAPASSLFLPTRFDYVRFQPEMILKRLREVGMSIDQSDGSLDTKAKREMMSKIMEREGARKATKEDAGDDEALDEQDEEEEADDETQADEKVKEDQQKPECIFETYCDTTTGIIITDGIEMRGIKASPAPRRVDNEVLMESYQFVRDREQPVDDERLTQFSQLVKPYARTCDSMSLELLIKLFKLDSSKSLNGLLVENNEVDSGSKMKSVLLDQHEIEAYKREYLECIYDDQETLVERTPIQEADSSSPKGDSSNSGNNNKTTSNYDIKKNGKRTLMSIMDQLLGLPSLSIERLRELVQENRNHLLKDLLQMSFTSERYVRPLIEAVVENCCIKKSKLRLLEINLDDGIMCQSLQQLIQQIEPGLALDYTLAHPQPNRLHGSQTSTTATTTSGQGRQASQASSATRTYTLKPDNIESLFSDHQLKGLDLVVFKDSSCYRPPSSSNGSDTSGVTEANTKDQLERTLATIGQSLKPGGYCMVLMRQEMTLAERVMVALSEPELVGLDQGENKPTMAAGDNEFAQLVKGVEQMNLKLEERYNKLLEASEKSLPKKRLLHLISTRSDRNGCVMLLFRLIGGGSSLDSHAGGEGELQSSSDTHTNDVIDAELQAKPVARVLIRVRHDNLDWLDELKAHFKQKQAEEEGEGENTEEDQRQNHSGDDNGATDEKTGTTEAANSHQQEKPGEGEGEEEEKQVWLCAVATKQNPINGLVGMMQSLRKELGSARLRCFYDAHTFAQLDESLVTLDRIEASECFQEALKRDHIWNCVDNQGQFGAYRHFTINDYLSYEDCLCSRQKKAVVVAAEEARQQLESQPELIEKNNSSHRELVQSGAYANNMIRGDLSSFAWFEAPYKHLSRELRRDRLVRVAYSALNFRDIMLATGRLPLDSLPLKLAMSDCQLGLEFSGLDGRGRRIMGMSASRGIATHVYLRPESSIKLDVPDWLDLSEAATIPVVYATAIMAIVCRGRARAGESILIHAGSGGVGQAAIRLALHFGLEVFTTVGSQEKRQFLLDEFGSLGLSPERIYNSRTCEFEHQIMESTRGRGVDLILNSLADDKLQASLNCLADNGRFLEIGKYDISIDTRLELLKLDVNKSFHGILVDKLFDEDDVGESFKNQLRQVKQVLEDGLKRGYIKPINYRVFKRQEVEEAFRYMATGKHIGKVLIEIDASINHPRDAVTYEGGQGVTREDPLRSEACRALKMVPRCQLSPVKSFIVTGGLGGFGLELCKWLVDQGARQLVITSRSGLRTGYQRAVLRRLETTGVKILIVTEREADACKPEGARQLLQMASELAPSKRVGGIFHLAMVLRDTLLENMSQEDFELVLAPKVAACSCLDAALDELGELGSELDYFVAFSSITSGKGNAGQANYAYANSCLERICERRRARGQHGLAIQWGAIGDVGVAYEHLGGNDVVIGGTIPQRIPSCLQTLGKLLCSPFAVCMSVVPVNRGQDGLSERGDLVGAIMHVLGIKDPSKVSEDATLGDLGLDSLMAVEIRQYIEREHDITLNIQEIRALTIARIREISETSEKTSSQAQAQTAASSSSATAAGATASDEPQKKQAANYGKQQTSTASQGAATRKTSKGTASGAAGKMALAKATAAASDASAAAKQSRFASLDKSLVSSFVPALELPADDFCHLNKHLPKADSGGGDDQEARPLFFLPPIHGQFDKLVSLCAHIKRPCVGLNWTRKLGQAQSVEEAVEICLNLLEQSDWQTQFRLRGSNPSAGDATTNEPNGTTNHQRRPSLTAQQQGGMHNNRAINNNSGHGEESRVQVVDLVGYSFGATIAFELMVAMERKYAQYSNRLERRLSNGNTQRPTMSAELEADWRQSPGGRGNQRNILKPGRLVLLDGSPKQIEMGSQYLAELTRKRPLKLEDKVDELLMVYMISNARSMGADRQQQHNNSSSNHKQQQQQQQSATGLDYWSILKELKRRTELRAKVEFASGELAKLLMASNNSSGNNESFNGNGRKQQSSLARTNESTGKRMNGGEEEKLPHAAADMKTKQQSIFYAMEAFLRRYELINSYKAKSRLANDCTLIRAEKIYLRPANEDDKAPVTKRRSENGRRLDGGEHITRTAASGGPPKVTKFNEDLDLTSVVMGRVDLYIMSGDHETFLSENEPEIGRIIANAAGSGRTGADTGRQLVVQRAEPGA